MCNWTKSGAHNDDDDDGDDIHGSAFRGSWWPLRRVHVRAHVYTHDSMHACTLENGDTLEYCVRRCRLIIVVVVVVVVDVVHDVHDVRMMVMVTGRDSVTASIEEGRGVGSVRWRLVVVRLVASSTVVVVV